MSNTNLSSNEVSGLIRAGSAALRIGDYEAAHATFQRALELDPANQEAQIGLRDAQRRMGTQAATSASSAEQIEYCYRHPDTETALHCTSCGRPICFRCSNPAAVGQLCPECLKGRRAPNYQVSAANIVVGGVVGLVVSILATSLIGFIGGGFFLLLIIFAAGPAAAELIVRAVERATRNKRGRPMQITVAVAMIAGGLITFFFIVPNLLAIALFLLVGVSTAVARLR
jgi:tetratricopeptide (TPR) repeat protein